MYGNGRRKGTVRFTFKPQGAVSEVAVTGTFSGWQPLAMRRRGDGVFARTVPAAGRTFEYRFVIDGEGIADPDHRTWVVSPAGALSSLGFFRDSRPMSARPDGARR